MKSHSLGLLHSLGSLVTADASEFWSYKDQLKDRCLGERVTEPLPPQIPFS